MLLVIKSMAMILQEIDIMIISLRIRRAYFRTIRVLMVFVNKNHRIVLFGRLSRKPVRRCVTQPPKMFANWLSFTSLSNLCTGSS